MYTYVHTQIDHRWKIFATKATAKIFDRWKFPDLQYIIYTQ